MLAVVVAIIITAVIGAAAQSVSDTMSKVHKIDYVVTVTGKAHVSD